MMKPKGNVMGPGCSYGKGKKGKKRQGGRNGY